MKKYPLIICMCIVLMLILGCGVGKHAHEQNSSVITPPYSKPLPEESDSNKENIDTEPDNEGEQLKDPVLSSSLYSVIPTSHSNVIMSEDGSTVLLYSDYDTIEILGEQYKTLAKKVALWQETQLEKIKKSESDYTQSAQEDLQYYDDGTFFGYTRSHNLHLKRLDSHVLSMIQYEYTFLGGAHPFYSIEGFNFDSTTGEILSLKDVVTDYSSFSKDAVRYIVDYLANSIHKDGLYPNYGALILESFENITWYFSASGINVIYNPYEIAPYAAGEIEIALSKEICSVYIKEEYRLTEDPGITSIEISKETPVSINGTDYTLIIDDNYSITNSSSRITVTLGGQSLPMMKYFSWVNSCYLIRQDDRTLLMLDGDMASDDYVTVLLDISDGSLVELAAVDAAIASPGVNTAKFSVRIDVLGTYSCQMEYSLISGNELKPLESEYLIHSVDSNLTTIAELPVTTREGKEILLPTGSVLRPTATDSINYVRLYEPNTNEEYTLYITWDNYVLMIGNKAEYEYFESLPYAG